MNSLEGYNSNGHEYRQSQIDRSNSRRLKWMITEARDIVNKKDEVKNTTNSNVLGDKNIHPTLHGNQSNNESNLRKNMFNPQAVNKFNNFKNKLK